MDSPEIGDTLDACMHRSGNPAADPSFCTGLFSFCHDVLTFNQNLPERMQSSFERNAHNVVAWLNSRQRSEQHDVQLILHHFIQGSSTYFFDEENANLYSITCSASSLGR